MSMTWTDISKELNVEWRQCFFEGKQVEELEAACEYISKKSSEVGDARYLNLAKEMCKLLADAPVKDSFTYMEPSDLDGIKAQRPVPSMKLPAVDKANLRDRVAGAWIGRIAGCLLGKPVEGFRTPVLYRLLKDTDNYPMHKYICKADYSSELIQILEDNNLTPNRCWAETIGGISPVDDDTNYTTFGLKLVDTYGKNFTPQNVMEGWTRWIPVAAVCTAERVAYMNAVNRLNPPETATFENPYREYIGAQIRADFFGYVNPGDPEKAAEMGFRDASISHIKNGIYGEMWVAAMLAAAAVCDDVETVIRAGLEQIPANSRITEDIELVLKWYHEGVSAMDAIAKIQERYNEFLAFDWCYVNSNAMIVTLGLLYGEKDIGKSMCLAVQPGFDTDCNGATVGSIVGMMVGEKAIPDYWVAPFQRKLMTSIDGYPVVDVDVMTDKTMELIEKE